ncbi:MAG: 23S rRNA (guanosine(2251)-2'-O)-methyltransferase RlmB [Desulfovibrionaceae bacterium]
MTTKPFTHTSQDTANSVLPGVKPVLELLESAPERIDVLLVKKGLRSAETTKILTLCREKQVRFSLVESPALDRLCAASHQGVIARLIGTELTSFADMLAQVAEAPLPIIVALDQVQDAGNVGTLARTLYALGGAGLVVPRHNSAYLGGGAKKAAAGALEYLPVAQVANLGHALDEAEETGFTIYGAELGHDSVNAFTAPLATPAVLVLGNEDKGLRPGVRKRCSQMLHIPQARTFDSLNVAQAGGILLALFAMRAQS